MRAAEGSGRVCDFQNSDNWRDCDRWALRGFRSWVARGRTGSAVRPLDQALIRRLVVLKLWRARDTFDPARLIQKFQDGRDFDWDDLRQLLNRAVVIDRERITADCVRGFGFLANLTDDERMLARDQYQREQAVAERLRASPARR
jgi:hypothetical protein